MQMRQKKLVAELQQAKELFPWEHLADEQQQLVVLIDSVDLQQHCVTVKGFLCWYNHH
jgi:hypothetical protein